MAERSSSASIQGVRLGGARSFEDEKSGTEFAERRRHGYVCALGHHTTVPFHVEAVPPIQWQCSVCPGLARHEDRLDEQVEAEAPKTGKTHFEQLMSRRTVEELESLLEEALSNYRRFGKSF